MSKTLVLRHGLLLPVLRTEIAEAAH